MLLKHKLVVLAVVALALNVCNLPGSSELDEIAIAAAQTLQAQSDSADPTQTPDAQAPPTDTPPVATDTPSAATDTPVPAPTNTPTQEQICDLAGFITDVTIPDGTKMSPGENFTKTWRLVNNGSCAWTSGYQLVFFGGDQMGGPSSPQLTNSIINPGQTIDISVHLTAPGSAGTYRGDWKLKNPSGDIFALSGGIPFYVEIEVVEPTQTPTPTTSSPTISTVTLIQNADGSIRSDGQYLQYPNVGDLSDNRGSQGFVQFDISGIPSNATISQVKVDFSDYDDILGSAFANLGCLFAYPGIFFPLNAGDYYVPYPLGAVVNWCSTSDLNTAKNWNDSVNALQVALGNTYYELRIQFRDTDTNNDNNADMIRFGDMKLIITYSVP